MRRSKEEERFAQRQAWRQKLIDDQVTSLQPACNQPTTSLQPRAPSLQLRAPSRQPRAPSL